MTPRLTLPATAAALAGLALAPVVASAQTGGATYSSSAKPEAAPAALPVRPVVEQITCRVRCKGIVQAQRRGSVVRLTGEGVEAAAEVAFLGRRGRRDDRFVAARPVGPGAIEAAVPRGARSGPVRVLTADGRRSLASRRRLLVGGRAPRAPLVETRADTRRVFLGGGSAPASVSFFLRRSVPVSVDVLRAGDGAVLAHWDLPAAAARSVNSVTWDGMSAGAPAGEGRYVWRVAPAGQTPSGRAAQAGAAAAISPTDPSFFLLAHRFPVLGPHTFGDGLGADRGHEGVDVFARCGTPLVAAIGGAVKHVAYQARAGHYIVISGTDGIDYAYMHLRDPSPLREGQAVATGAPVGVVGQTGRASGCHLHLEMWSGHGWGAGGALLDPMPHLRAWDGLS